MSGKDRGGRPRKTGDPAIDSEDIKIPKSKRPRRGGDWLTVALFNQVIDRISNGDTLKGAARALGFDEGAWRYRISTNDKLSTRYAKAREQQAEAWADSIVEIADDGTNDTKTIETKDGGYDVADHEWIARSKLRVDTRKWLMAKLVPKRYGEKVEIDNKGTITHEAGDSVVALVAKVRAARPAAPIPPA